jgi:hypothetical protein
LDAWSKTAVATASGKAATSWRFSRELAVAVGAFVIPAFSLATQFGGVSVGGKGVAYCFADILECKAKSKKSSSPAQSRRLGVLNFIMVFLTRQITSLGYRS